MTIVLIFRRIIKCNFCTRLYLSLISSIIQYKKSENSSLSLNSHYAFKDILRKMYLLGEDTIPPVLLL